MRSIGVYVCKRILAAIPTLVLVSLVAFSVMHLLPGDPAMAILGPDATEESIRYLRKEMRLDLPLPAQYLAWVGSALRGDLGNSLHDNEPVGPTILRRFAITFQLGMYVILISAIVGVPAGIAAAVRRNSLTDSTVTAAALALHSLPGFVIGFILIYVFAVYLGWLPPGGYVPIGDGLGRHLRSMVLPALARSGSSMALIMRMTRSAILEVLRADYIRTAHAKGLPRLRVLYRHALRNALIPVVTVTGLQLGYVLGGTVVIESVFTLPGIGRLLIESLLLRDYPVVQGLILVFGLIFIVINLLVDIVYCLLDPRLSYG